MKKIFYISLLFFSACQATDQHGEHGHSHEEESKESPTIITISEEQQKKLALKTQLVLQKEFRPSVKALGTLEVSQESTYTVNFPYPGFIKKIHSLEGETVKKDQALFTIYSEEFVNLQKEYLQNHNDLIFIQKDLERQTVLAEAQTINTKTLEKITQEYENVKAIKAGLQSKLQVLEVDIQQLEEGKLFPLYTLRAPFDGVLRGLTVNTGAFFSAGETLAEVLDLHHLHAFLYIYEKDRAAFANKLDEIKIAIPSLQLEAGGNLVAIGSHISNDKRIKIQVHVDNLQKTAPLIGAFVEGSFFFAPQPAYAVPKSAVVSYENKNYVFYQNQIDKKHFDIQEVQVIAEDQTTAYLSLSVSLQGKEVVTEQSYSLLMQLKNTNTGHAH